MKQYNNLTDIEKRIIREYKEWCKSDAPSGLKYEMAMQWRKRAKEKGIEHLL
jgi:hypothetical protein